MRRFLPPASQLPRRGLPRTLCARPTDVELRTNQTDQGNLVRHKLLVEQAARSRAGPLRGCSIFVMTLGRCGKVAPQSLRPWLPDVELSTDRAHRGNSVRREQLDDQLRRLLLQRVRLVPGRGRLLYRYLRTPDDHHEKLVRAHRRELGGSAHSLAQRPTPEKSPPTTPRTAPSPWRWGPSATPPTRCMLRRFRAIDRTSISG
jgi:hypothetical protein